MYRKLKADYIFPITQAPIKNGVVVVNQAGTIVEITSQQTYTNVEQYKGIICPGFINAHCHLELSHLKNTIPKHTGLVNFIQSIIKVKASFDTASIRQAVIAGEQEMQTNGIVGVGDISNDTNSFKQKEKGNLHYHTFVELLGFSPKQAAKFLAAGQHTYQQAPKKNRATASLTPHAPYTVSGPLLEQIDVFNQQHTPLMSIHNQECDAERAMFEQGTGAFIELHEQLGTNIHDFFTPPKMSSLQYTLKHLSKTSKLLLVHNTFTKPEDISFAHQHSEQIHWCFCPNANLYIENRLPNIQAFRNAKAKITVGTDSLTSNWKLCILAELQAIHQAFPQIPLQELLEWATINGATFFGWEKQLGSLEIGKQPGINLLEQVDLEICQLTPKTTVKVLV